MYVKSLQNQIVFVFDYDLANIIDFLRQVFLAKNIYNLMEQLDIHFYSIFY